MNMRIRRCFLPLFTSLLFFVGLSFAQITNITDATSTPVPGAGHDYIKSFSETVNPANGSLSLRIEVPTPLGRRMTLPFSFAHDSNGLHTVGGGGHGFPGFGSVSGGGWRYTTPTMTWTPLTYTYPGNSSYHCTYATGFVFNDATGGRHSLGMAWEESTTFPENLKACPYTSYGHGGDNLYGAAFPANAGPGSINPRIVDPDGTVYTIDVEAGAPISSIEDRNGNVIYESAFNSKKGYSVTDTLNRTLLSVSGFGSTGDTVSVSGLSIPYTLTWGTVTSSFTTTTTNLYTPGDGAICQPISADSETYGVITAITLPNGKEYTFTYDPTFGEVSKITYPDGGYVSYTWGYNPQSSIITYASSNYNTLSCVALYDTPAVVHRYVSYDGTTVALQQDFSYQTNGVTVENGTGGESGAWSTKVTTVTTHDLIRGTSFNTVYTYSSVPAPGQPYIPTVAANQLPVEQSIVYQDTNGATLRTVTKGWHDAFELTCELQTLDNGQISGAFYTYGPFAQVTDKKEYDYGLITSTSVCQNSATAPTGITPTRETVTNYQSFGVAPIFPTYSSIWDKPCQSIVYDASGNRTAETDSLYDGGTSVCGSATALPVSQGVTGLPTGTHDETNYGASSTQPRGNLTTLIGLCLQGAPACSSGNPTTTYAYDQTGQTVSMVDPNGNAAGGTPSQHTTTYSHADSYSSCSGSAPPSGSTDAYLTQITYPPTNGVAHVEKFCFGYNDGQLRGSTDQNNLTTTYKYNDFLLRLKETDLPNGGQTLLSYNDTAPSPSVTTQKKLNGSGQYVVSVAVRDGYGHVTQTQLTSDPQGTVSSEATYDGLGRTYTATNPHRGSTDPTSSTGTTTYSYDALGRKTTETYPDNSVLTTAYCGPNTLVTDPTKKWRRSRVNGLGQLVEVDEPNAVGATVAATGCPGTGEPIWVTSYTNDVLGNLTQVVQNGSHTRTFVYDSLSRLLTSANPETGSITYTYNADSTVLAKTNARSITATYTYDALHRETGVSYSNGDPSLTFSYDEPNCLNLPTPCHNIGHRTSMTDGAGSESWAYYVDKTNSRSIHQERRTTNSTPNNITKNTFYYLDLAGNVTQIVYPTGRTVNYTLDSADRPSSAADASNGITYVAGWKSPPANTNCTAGAVCYTPQGSVYSMSIGQTSSFTGFNISETFNSRLQPQEIKASSSAGNAIDITYSFVDPSSGGNAGHVYGIANNLNSSRSQTFTYDQVNRIASAGTTATTGTYCWGYGYSYDAWGNLLGQGARSLNCTQTIMGMFMADGNNHLSAMNYDASGNALGDGINNYTWDGESQMKTAAGVTYAYDGDGRRVAKVGSKLYWYGSGGEILSETDTSGNTLNEYIFFGGERVALVPATGGSLYYAEDMLGSSRVIVQANGTLCYDADFTPFGGERAYTSTCAQNYKFEGKERDTETGNDDFGARYYSWRFGRWLSSDWSAVPVAVPYANLNNPQTLNLYAMVADDPESFADLDGHDPPPASAQVRSGSENAPGDCGNLPSTSLCLQENLDNQVAKAAEAANATEQDQKEAQNPTLNIQVIRSDNLTESGNASVNGQIANLKTDMGKIGIDVNVTSDSTRSNIDLKHFDTKSLDKGAIPYLFVTSKEAGSSTSGSGFFGKTAGVVINEFSNGGDKVAATHETLHILRGDIYAGKNGASWGREFHVRWETFKLEHGWTGGMGWLRDSARHPPDQ